ncbi:MAG TPA: alpha/beta hydrolase [Micromonosporaceae bacterium]|nr:alpha/beta hydrolase [Micromonosporaceae bacterium]HCU50600.1 alpha/beta hydrolase [Micromonosporaceae bacterium]
MSDEKTPAGKPPTSKRKRAGVIGAVVGVAAAGIAAGVAVERVVVRRSRRDDPLAEEPFGMLPYDETLTVTTADGIELHVEIVDPLKPAGKPTLIFVHGFCLDQGTFHFQRQAIDRQGDHRMVFYDQPGHGLSSSLTEGEYELPALGDALYDVIKATTPEGPIILIGHSMGGMTIMACAEQHPQLFKDRVVGVVLIATSGGQVNGSQLFGLPNMISRAAPGVMSIVNSASRLTGGMVDKARKASTDLAFVLTRRYGFGSDKPSPTLVSYVERMNSRTSTDTVARFLRTLYSHARYPALRALGDLPVLLISGEKDMVTPLTHSEEIARLLPHATYVKLPNSGHVVMLECADEVNEIIERFLERL